MTHNELLFWLSARQSGSWVQFRSAVDGLQLADSGEGNSERSEFPLHQRLRFNLQSLGHVEFDARECEGGWRVAPPTLAANHLPDRVIAVLCGARSPKLLKRISQSAEGIDLEVQQCVENPDAIRVGSTDENRVVQLAERSGLLYQPNAPATIISCLPSVDDLSGFTETSLPFGRDRVVRRFIVGRRHHRWVDSSVDEASNSFEGLFQFTLFQTPEYYLRVPEGRSGVRTVKINGQAGKYFLLSHKRRRVLRYHGGTRRLAVPTICQPPPLAERALILCSGFPPAYDSQTRTLTYSEISEGIAGMVAELLKQELS